MIADDGHGPGGHAGRQVPARVASSARVNVAFPFSQVKIEGPGDHLVPLTALVEEPADLVAAAVPGPEVKVWRRRARELADQVC
jgi:hypothetical protein